MVVRQSGEPRRSQLNAVKISSPNKSSLVEDYYKTLCLYSISINKNTSYMLGIAFVVGQFSLSPLLIKGVIQTLALLAFSICMGYFVQYLLCKLDDTTLSSYIYATFISTVHIPVFIILAGFFISLSSLIYLLYSSLTMYIANNIFLRDHQFPDSRSQFIYSFITLVCFAIFFAGIMANI